MSEIVIHSKFGVCHAEPMALADIKKSITESEHQEFYQDQGDATDAALVLPVDSDVLPPE